MFSTLIKPDQLRQHLNDPDWVLVDCRFDLNDPAAGERTYAAGHLPGALFAQLERDLSAPITPASGRHPLPRPTTLARTFCSWGIDARVQVVAYDQDSGAFAARLWWLLRWLGHEAVAVLDGGYAAWIRAGGEINQVLPHRTPRQFVSRVRSSAFVDAQEVAQRVCDPDARVLDARAPERFAGTVEPLDAVAGHIPGARNHPFANSLDAQKTFLPRRQLRQQFERSLSGVAPDDVIAMCGSGVTACHLLLAMEDAGLSGGKLYAGSWSEWIRDPQRPVAVGT